MAKVSPAKTASVDKRIKETQTLVMDPSKGRASLLGEASSFLIALSVRAAQNHAVYCLDDWIAPSHVHVANEPRLSPSSDDSTLRDDHNFRPKRITRGCDKLAPVLVGGGSDDDRSSTC